MSCSKVLEEKSCDLSTELESSNVRSGLRFEPASYREEYKTIGECTRHVNTSHSSCCQSILQSSGCDCSKSHCSRSSSQICKSHSWHDIQSKCSYNANRHPLQSIENVYGSKGLFQNPSRNTKAVLSNSEKHGDETLALFSNKNNSIYTGDKLKEYAGHENGFSQNWNDKESKVPSDHYKILSPQKSKQPSQKSKRLDEIMEPLNAERLRPIRQKTRNAVVSVLEDESVCLEFLQSKGGESLVVEVFRISSDGIKITTYHPNGRKGIPLQDTPSSIPQTAVSYAFSGLPQKYWKKYQYADKFVKLVRMKTPKVTIIV